VELVTVWISGETRNKLIGSCGNLQKLSILAHNYGAVGIVKLVPETLNTLHLIGSWGEPAEIGPAACVAF